MVHSVTLLGLEGNSTSNGTHTSRGIVHLRSIIMTAFKK